MGELFPDRARARNSDPGTSHAAAARASCNLRDSQITVLAQFASSRKMTDEQLVDRINEQKIKTTDSGIRSRRAELAKAGMLEECGKVPLRSGSNGRLWKATDKGNTYLEVIQW